MHRDADADIGWMEPRVIGIVAPIVAGPEAFPMTAPADRARVQPLAGFDRFIPLALFAIQSIAASNTPEMMKTR